MHLQNLHSELCIETTTQTTNTSNSLYVLTKVFVEHLFTRVQVPICVRVGVNFLLFNIIREEISTYSFCCVSIIFLFIISWNVLISISLQQFRKYLYYANLKSQLDSFFYKMQSARRKASACLAHRKYTHYLQRGMDPDTEPKLDLEIGPRDQKGIENSMNLHILASAKDKM